MDRGAVPSRGGGMRGRFSALHSPRTDRCEKSALAGDPEKIVLTDALDQQEARVAIRSVTSQKHGFRVRLWLKLLAKQASGLARLLEGSHMLLLDQKANCLIIEAEPPPRTGGSSSPARDGQGRRFSFSCSQRLGSIRGFPFMRRWKRSTRYRMPAWNGRF